MADTPEVYTDADAMARAIYEANGGDIRLALPLGLGKPITIVNALVRAAVDDPALSLKIFTALSLQRPDPSSELEKRFLGPAMDRLFGTAPSLTYVDLIKRGELPDNIEVSEFFFQAASWLGNDYAQRQYISANYTHARDVLISQKPNVLAQLMPRDGARFSMSSNTDISADLFTRRSAGEMDFMAVAELNDALPYMDGPAEIEAREVAMVLEPPRQVDLFSVPRRPVADAQHAIALHVSRLVPDGGTLQIGIGAIGDAVANALIARDRAALHDLWRTAPFPLQGAEEGPFRTGLYAVTEMLVGGLVALFEADILRREAHDGAVVHAGFFVDARDMYQRLRALPPDRRARIRMMPVSFTNALYGDEPTKRDDRRDARFVNGAMQVSLLGDAMSDSAKPGQVVSGVGGQFNFFEQAFALDDAHAVLTLPATRQSGGDLGSNIVWQLPVTTVPRHMRDVVVTEYGAAFLRGLPDEEVIKRLICIADSRFQQDLAGSAKKAGKLDPDWTVPPAHASNTPETIATWLAPYREGLLPDYPLGTDFTDIEQLLVKALADLSEAQSDKRALLSLVWASLTTTPHPQEGPAMERMGYDATPSLAEPLQARALRGALRRLA
ncbi:acetyl-CoA hydrolase/transferase C-terminal domain-containing protein [Roseovarius sp.]|uniref:acetyl-CoA hydrolase/transferase C-terminal domain-containing protein n=1 Tax=Roseovarius sp. TaxID=1486281 RepID=UPI003B5BE0AB